MLRIGIIMGSTRPNRVCEGVANWVTEQCKNRTDAQFELVDIKDYNLPLLDEPISPAMSQDYTHEHTKKWSAQISTYDAFIFVTPEYNHGPSGALKNAIDFLYHEWNNKVAGFVGYGSAGGTRVVEALRMIMGELQIATVRSQVALSLKTDFENYSIFKPADYHVETLNTMVDQVILWGTALQGIRKDATVELPHAQISETPIQPLQ